MKLSVTGLVVVSSSFAVLALSRLRPMSRTNIRPRRARNLVSGTSGVLTSASRLRRYCVKLSPS